MKSLLFLAILILFSVNVLRSEDIGAISIGLDDYLAPKSEYEDIRPNGIACGLLVPVRFQRLVTHLKIKFSFHQVDVIATENPNAEFLHIINEMLFGYYVSQGNNFAVLPQIGFGVTGERYKISQGVGGAHVDIFIDLSCRFDYKLPGFNIGTMLNFERDLNLGYGSYLSENRLNLSFLISK